MSSDILKIPSSYSQLDQDLKKNKLKYMNYIYDLIISETEDDKITKEKINVFKFENTNLIVSIASNHYKEVVDNLLNYYIKLELFENCNKLKRIIDNID